MDSLKQTKNDFNSHITKSIKMSKQHLELQTILFKNKINTDTLLDILDKGILSETTVSALLHDIKAVFVDSKDKSDKVFVFTDGGCKRNGRVGAIAAFGVHFPQHPHLNVVESLTPEESTNQRAELMGVFHAFWLLAKNFQNCQAVVCTDSMYAIKCVNEWSKSWEKNGWKTSAGKEVKHSDIIVNILKLTEIFKKRGLEVSFKHVFSHTKEPLNKESKEHKLWLGNFTVDKMINDTFNDKK
jgi:ribonuclease HI